MGDQHRDRSLRAAICCEGINPSTGALVKQSFVTLPADGGVYYNVGGLLGVREAEICGRSVREIDSLQNRHLLWEKSISAPELSSSNHS